MTWQFITACILILMSAGAFRVGYDIEGHLTLKRLGYVGSAVTLIAAIAVYHIGLFA